MFDPLDQNKAIRAATALAARFGVQSTEPTMLANGSNAIIHLAPTPVVARVAMLTALVRPNVATYFEDAWRGPIGWDLACLELTSRLNGQHAIAGYPGAPGLPERKPFLAGRKLAQLMWSMVFQWRFPKNGYAPDIQSYRRSWRNDQFCSNSPRTSA